MRYKSLLLIASLVVFTAALSFTRTSAQDSPRPSSKDSDQPERCIAGGCVSPPEAAAAVNDLAGTWLTRTTPPPDGPPPFQGIFTFAGDGSLIATQSGGEFPALGNPQLGLWSKNPGNKRQFTLTYYGQDFDGQLQFTDSYRVRGAITMDASGATFSGVLDITVYDPDGNEVFSDCCATFEGKRGGVGAPLTNASQSGLSNQSGRTPLNRFQGWSRRRN